MVSIDGDVLYQVEPLTEPIDNQEAVRGFDPVPVYDDQNTLSRVIAPYIEGNGAHRYSIIFDFDSDRINTIVSKNPQNVSLLALSGVITVAIIMNTVLELLFTRHVKKLSERAAIIQAGDYSQSLSIDKNDEIGDLAKALNAMADHFKHDIEKLRELDEAKTKFMAIVTHNLHTPVAIIGDYVETVLHMKDLDDSKTKMLETVKANNVKLKALIEDTVLISSMDIGENPITLRKTDLNVFFNRIANEFVKLAENKQLTTDINIEPFAEKSYISTPFIQSALWNILDNSLKFTKEGTVGMHASVIEGVITIDVTDTGIGMNEDIQKTLFSTFQHGTDIYQFDFEGVGLGLYTSKLIVTNHGGDINIKSNENNGTVVQITLPYITDPAQAPESLRDKLDTTFEG